MFHFLFNYFSVITLEFFQACEGAILTFQLASGTLQDKYQSLCQTYGICLAVPLYFWSRMITCLLTTWRHSLTVLLLAKRIVLKWNIIYLSVAMHCAILRGFIISFKFTTILTSIFGKKLVEYKLFVSFVELSTVIC